MRSGKWFLTITGLFYLLMGGLECIGATNDIINEGISVRFALMGVIGAFLLFTGVVGMVFRESYSKAVFLIIIGIANIFVVVINEFIFPPVNPVAVIMYMPIPALYIYGAYRNL